MLADEWRSLFEERILERGREYWRQGHVDELRCGADSICAVVYGSEDYDVEIWLDDGWVNDMYCSCPYAEDHAACKHMAAVLFAAEAIADTPGASQDGCEAGNALAWQEVLQQMTAGQMREFLQDILPRDSGLQERLSLAYGKEEENGQLLLRWEKELNTLVRRFRRGDAYISYTMAEDFYAELVCFLEARLPCPICGNAVMPAFRLTGMVCRVAVEEDAEDPDGYMDELTDLCTAAWQDAISAASSEQRAEIYSWFSEQVLSASDPLWSDMLENFLFRDDWEPADLQKNLVLLDRLLKHETLSESRAWELLEWRVHTMRALGMQEAEIEALWQQYRSYRFVRERERKRLLAEKEYDRVIELLRQEKTLAADDLLLQQRCSEELIELYRLTGQQEAYRRELLTQIESYPQDGMDHIHQLRGVTPDAQWPEVLDRLLRLPILQALRFELLADDAQWQRLFAEIEQQNDLYALEHFMEPLMKWKSEKTLALFSRLIDAAMAGASDRNAYRCILAHATSVSAYPGGHEFADRLLKKWEAQYHRKSALLDEMKKMREKRGLGGESERSRLPS